MKRHEPHSEQFSAPCIFRLRFCAVLLRIELWKWILPRCISDLLPCSCVVLVRRVHERAQTSSWLELAANWIDILLGCVCDNCRSLSHDLRRRSLGATKFGATLLTIACKLSFWLLIYRMVSHTRLISKCIAEIDFMVLAFGHTQPLNLVDWIQIQFGRTIQSFSMPFFVVAKWWVHPR